MLFRKHIDEITWDDVVSFCEQGLQESSVLDYKRDFPRRLQHVIAAMANTLGGIIIIGVDQTDDGVPRLPLEGIEFETELRLRVTNIDLNNITPPTFPEVAVCTNSDGDRAILVVRVHQSHQTPHAVNSNTQVYLRTGDRISPERLVDIDEIEWLKEKRGKSVELRKNLLKRARERFNYFYNANNPEHSIQASMEMTLSPVYPKIPFTQPPSLVTKIPDIKVPDYLGPVGYTFPLPHMASQVIVQNGIILERTLEGGARVFHTELNIFGLYYYKQSILHGHTPGDATNIIRASDIYVRLDQFLDSAELFFELLGYHGPLTYNFCLKDIHDCPYGPWEGPYSAVGSRLFSPDPEVNVERIVSTSDLPTSKPSIILETAQTIAWTFGYHVNERDLDNCYQSRKGSMIFQSDDRSYDRKWCLRD